jgi:hypothetical protein
MMTRRDALARLTQVVAMTGGAACAPGLFAAAPVRAAAGPESTLPDWVPAPGTRRNISRNVLADVDPCPARDCAYSGVIGQRAVLAAWCGAAFAPAYGNLGAWITTGGGHGDYFGNEVYAFELDSLRWVRLCDPFPGGPLSDADYNEGEYAPGIPLSSHTYQHTQYLPPELGGGKKGSLLLVVSYAAGKLAQGTGRAHAFDLATGRWTRYSTNKATVRINATSGSCFDADRKAFWRVPYGGAQIESLSTVDRSFRMLSPGAGGGNNFGVDHVCGRDPIRDLLVVLDWPRDAPASLWALDLKAPHRWSALATTGPAAQPEGRGMGLEWCPLQCFVGYEGSRAPHVRKLIPPASDPLGTPWRWETEDLTGDAPVGRDKGPRMSYSRFRWAPSIRSFVWADDHRLPVQAWRLRGT